MAGYRFLVIVSATASLFMIGVGMIVARLPLRTLELSGSLRDVGYLASVFAISYLIVQLPIGNLADRWGAKRFLILGYALCCASGIVFFFADSPTALFLGRFIQGAGEAPIWALGPAVLSLAYPHAKGKVIGIYNASIHAGLAIGPLLGFALFSKTQSGQLFLLYATFCLCGGLAVVMWLPHSRPMSRLAVTTAPSLRQLGRLIATPKPMFALSAILVYGAGYGAFITVLPGSLTLSKGFSSFHNSVFFTLFYVAVSVSQLVTGPMSDRYGRHVFMVAGLALAAFGFASFSQYQLPYIYIPLALASLGLGIFSVSSMAFLNECVPETLKATISGAYFLAWGLGYFLGPLFIGWTADLSSPLVGYYTLALLLALHAVILLPQRTRQG